MRIITIANQKGGTAKSTTAAALAQAGKEKGLKVLAVDLDPQGNLSMFMGADTTRKGALQLLEGQPASSCTQTTACGVDIIPASWGLSSITSYAGSARRLLKGLKAFVTLDVYDMIIIDTPPTAGELQYNALMASNGLIIPIRPETGSLQGLYQIANTAEQIQQNNPQLRILGYIITQAGRSTLHRQLQEQIREAADAIGIPFIGSIRQAIALQEAQTLQRSLYEYAPNSNPAKDYIQILDTII